MSIDGPMVKYACGGLVHFYSNYLGLFGGFEPGDSLGLTREAWFEARLWNECSQGQHLCVMYSLKVVRGGATSFTLSTPRKVCKFNT